MVFWWFQLCQWWCIAVVVLEGKGENRNYLYLSDTSSSDVRISMESNPRSADGQTRIRIRPESDQTQNCVIGTFHWKPVLRRRWVKRRNKKGTLQHYWKREMSERNSPLMQRCWNPSPIISGIFYSFKGGPRARDSKKSNNTAAPSVFKSKWTFFIIKRLKFQHGWSSMNVDGWRLRLEYFF